MHRRNMQALVANIVKIKQKFNRNLPTEIATEIFVREFVRETYSYFKLR